LLIEQDWRHFNILPVRGRPNEPMDGLFFHPDYDFEKEIKLLQPHIFCGSEKRVI